MPGGFLLGRGRTAGKGDVQLLNLAQLQANGIATTSSVAAAIKAGGGGGSSTGTWGFGFSAGKTLAADEVLGFGSWSKNVQFTAGGLYQINSLVAATASTVLFLGILTSPTTYTQVGTITFAAGSTVGTLAWTGGACYVLAGTFMCAVAPHTPDATLASISALIEGVQA